jgi:hypothetical protein
MGSRKRLHDQKGFCSYCGKSTRKGFEKADPAFPAPKCECPGGGDWKAAYKQERAPGTVEDEVNPDDHPTAGWRLNSHHGVAKTEIDPTDVEDMMSSFGATVATLIRHRVFYRETIEQAAKAANVSKTTAFRLLTEALTLLRVSLM